MANLPTEGAEETASEGLDPPLNFSGIYGPAPSGQTRPRSPSATRRRVDNPFSAPQTDRGVPSGGVPSPGVGSQQGPPAGQAPVVDMNAIQAMFQTMLTKMSEQDQRQQAQAVELHQRLSRLEGDGSQGVPPVPPVSQPPGLGAPGGGYQGGALMIPPPPPLPDPSWQNSAGGRMDTKWLPSMPLPQFSQWKTRLDEVHYFWSWIEQLSSWLALLHPSYLGEIKEVMLRIEEDFIERL